MRERAAGRRLGSTGRERPVAAYRAPEKRTFADFADRQRGPLAVANGGQKLLIEVGTFRVEALAAATEVQAWCGANVATGVRSVHSSGVSIFHVN